MKIARGLFQILGSSPLARGLRSSTYQSVIIYRIIPARAGFTLLESQLFIVTRDHPRSRGVYGDPQNRSVPGVGSSPLARGLPCRTPQHYSTPRIIPARAGFTRGQCYLRLLRKGSSPLARGLLIFASPEFVANRIIPARAGFTPRGDGASGWCEDHPRSRGVYAACVFVAHVTQGSSPLARGLPLFKAMDATGKRIIPARAGFTMMRDSIPATHQDHPRSRGVYS